MSGYTHKAMDGDPHHGKFVSVARQFLRSFRPCCRQAAALRPQRLTPPQTALPLRECPKNTYEPEVTKLLAEILPRFVNVQIAPWPAGHFRETKTLPGCPPGQPRNCDEWCLTLLFNKTRQTSITNELIDIVGGAETLK